MGGVLSYERGTPAILPQKKSRSLQGHPFEPFNVFERSKSALEATQGQMDGFFNQLPYKCHLEEVVSAEN